MSDEKYHRTFLPYNPRPQVPAGTGHTRNRQPAWDPDLVNQPTGVVPPSPDSPYSRYYPPGSTRPAAPPQPSQRQGVYPFTRRFSALRIGPTGIEPRGLDIWEKRDQRFNDVATSWERVHSKICSGGGSLDPIVDSSTMVCAHFGLVHGQDLIFPAVDEPNSANPKDYLAAGISIYVWGYKMKAPTGWGPMRYSGERWAVLALPDGEVLYADMVSSNNGEAEPSWSPIDWFSVARVGATMAGHYAARILSAAARKGYRLLSGPTKAIADRIRNSVAARQFPKATVVKEGVVGPSKESAKRIQERLNRELEDLSRLNKAVKDEAIDGMHPWQQWTMALTDEVLVLKAYSPKSMGRLNRILKKLYGNADTNFRSVAAAALPTREQARVAFSIAYENWWKLSEPAKLVVRKLGSELGRHVNPKLR